MAWLCDILRAAREELIAFSAVEGNRGRILLRTCTNDGAAYYTLPPSLIDAAAGTGIEITVKLEAGGD